MNRDRKFKGIKMTEVETTQTEPIDPALVQMTVTMMMDCIDEQGCKLAVSEKLVTEHGLSEVEAEKISTIAFDWWVNAYVD
jgi:hypothetical protein